MSIRASDLRRGMGVIYKDSVWVVFSTEHVAKGNKRSYMQIELKNAKTGQLIKERFRVGDALDQAIFDRKPMEYLYSDGEGHVMMDLDSYEQVHIPEELIGDQGMYLSPNLRVEVAFVDGQPVAAELPNTVELKIVETPPQVKGATATSQLKDAICEGGARLRVPPFVENGQIVKVDTRSGEYLGRA
jgi:elongation factor P